MPIEILMPALSPTMTEGNLAKWTKKEGDKVKPGDVIAEIETDKATMEVEAVDEGTIGKLVVAAGTEAVKVNDVIALLLAPGEDKKTLDSWKPKAKEESRVESQESSKGGGVGGATRPWHQWHRLRPRLRRKRRWRLSHPSPRRVPRASAWPQARWPDASPNSAGLIFPT